MSEFSWTFDQCVIRNGRAYSSFFEFRLALLHALEIMSEAMSTQHNRTVTMVEDGSMRVKLTYEGRSLLVGSDIGLMTLESQIVSSCYPRRESESSTGGTEVDFCMFGHDGPIKLKTNNDWQLDNAATMAGFSLKNDKEWSIESQLAEQMLGKLILPRTVADAFAQAY